MRPLPALAAPPAAAVSALPTDSTLAGRAPRGAWSSGLEDVVAAGTRLSSVDGDAGRLVIAGAPLEALADRRFVDVASALLDRAATDGGDSGDADGPRRDGALAARIAAARRALWPRFVDDDALGLADPMAALRATLSRVDGDDAAVFIAATHVVVAAWIARRSGDVSASGVEGASAGDVDAAPIGDERADRDDIDAGTWLLARATGRFDVEAGAALDRYLTTVVDHGMNASTFTARVVASTGADLSSSVVAAVGALSGPLHGGAPGPVLDLLDRVARRAADDDVDATAAAGRVIDDDLARGRRLMGFGHRIYRVRDPRAAVLEATVGALLQHASPGLRARLELARVVEREATARLAARHPERPLPANVEFFTAILLDAIGLRRAGFSALFAAGRVAGWCAHVVEQRRTGKLIRPRSDPIP